MLEDVMQEKTDDPRYRIDGGRRCAVIVSENREDWFVGVSPRNGLGSYVEGPWEDWVELAKNILSADAEWRGEPTELTAAQQEIELLKAERNAFCVDVARVLREIDQPNNPFDAEREWFAHQVWGLVKAKVGDAQREIERLQGLVKSAYVEGAIDGRHCGRVTYDGLWRGSRFPGALAAAPAQPAAPKTDAAAMEKALNEIYDVATSGLHTEDALMQCGRHAMRALGLGQAAPQSSEMDD